MEQLVLSSGAAVVVTDEVAVQRTGEAEVAEAKVAPNSFHQLPCLHSNIDPMLWKRDMRYLCECMSVHKLG